MGSFASYEARKPTVLTVPGLGGSGRSHWQSLWEEARPDTIRVELGMWSTPHRNAWVTRLDQAIRQAQAPVILAAHSLGCLAVAWWAELSPQPYGWPVAGALLVAPADVDRADAPEALKGFAPSREPASLPLDPRRQPGRPVDLDRPRAQLAVDWGSHFVDAGHQGHINAASGLGWWQEGQELLGRVIAASGMDRPSPSGPLSPSEARAVLAVNATDAAQAYYLGR